MSSEEQSGPRMEVGLYRKKETREVIEIDREAIEGDVWRPSIFENFRDSLEMGASTKELKRSIGREDAKIRITGRQDRFDKNFPMKMLRQEKLRLVREGLLLIF